jgi:hypothetical protein
VTSYFQWFKRSGHKSVTDEQTEVIPIISPQTRNEKNFVVTLEVTLVRKVVWIFSSSGFNKGHLRSKRVTAYKRAYCYGIISAFHSLLTIFNSEPK